MGTELSVSIRKSLDELSEELSKARAKALMLTVMKTGEILKRGQKLLANQKNGVFQEWVEENGFSKSQAYRCISAFEVFGEYQNFARFDDTAMFLLAAPSAPEPARDRAKSLADKGERITHEKAKELIKKATPKPPAAEKITSQLGRYPESAEKTSTEQPSTKCHECGSTERDDDGDCAKCKRPAFAMREPGDDTEAIKAEKAKRRNSGKETVTRAQRSAAIKGLGPAARVLKAMGCQRELDQLDAIIKIIKAGAA